MINYLFTKKILDKATMTTEEEKIVKLNICPKCNVALHGLDQPVKYYGCYSCRNIWILS